MFYITVCSLHKETVFRLQDDPLSQKGGRWSVFNWYIAKRTQLPYFNNDKQIGDGIYPQNVHFFKDIEPVSATIDVPSHLR